MLNSWPTFEPTQPRTKKKSARLIGKEPGKVFVLATLHDFRGRALRLYHLPSRKMRHFSRPNQKLGTSTHQEAWRSPTQARFRRMTWTPGAVTPKNRRNTLG